MNKKFRCMCRRAYRRLLQQLRAIYATNNLQPLPYRKLIRPNVDRNVYRARLKAIKQKPHRHEQNK